MGKKDPEEMLDTDIADPVESNKPEELRILEAVLFASDELMTTARLKAILPGQPDVRRIRSMVEKINVQLQKERHPFEVVEIGGGFQFRTIAFYHPWVRQLFKEKAVKKLSIQALECLAIIAYKQPISKAEIEAIRGVVSDGAMKTLLEKRLATITGRSDKPGKPLLYGTTHAFLTYFGLNKIDDLPRIEEFEALAREKMDELSLEELETPELSEVEPEGQEGTVAPEDSSLFEVSVDSEEENAASAKTASESGTPEETVHDEEKEARAADQSIYTDATVKDFSLQDEAEESFEVGAAEAENAATEAGVKGGTAEAEVSNDTTTAIDSEKVPDMAVEETIADVDLENHGRKEPETPEATVAFEVLEGKSVDASGEVSETVVLGKDAQKDGKKRSPMADEATVFDMSAIPQGASEIDETVSDAVFEVKDDEKQVAHFSDDDMERLGGALMETRAINPEQLKRKKNKGRSRKGGNTESDTNGAKD